MRRGLVIALSVMGVLLIVLSLALASVGTHLDEAKIERNELQYEMDDLRQEVDTISVERGNLQNKVDEQLKTIEQLKAEVERARSPAQPPAPASTPDAAPVSAAP